MIKCKNKGCEKQMCCVHCKTKCNNCYCEIAQELNSDKTTILEKCEYAEE